MSFKPTGYNSLSPYLIVEGANATIEFAKEALDAEPLRRFEGEDGRIMHSEVRIDDTVVMIADAGGGTDAVSAHIHIYVPDVDETYRRALAAGGVSLQEPIQRDDPDKRGGVQDPAGTIWWFAQQMGES